MVFVLKLYVCVFFPARLFENNPIIIGMECWAIEKHYLSKTYPHDYVFIWYSITASKIYFNLNLDKSMGCIKYRIV